MVSCVARNDTESDTHLKSARISNTCSDGRLGRQSECIRQHRRHHPSHLSSDWKDDKLNSHSSLSLHNVDLSLLELDPTEEVYDEYDVSIVQEATGSDIFDCNFIQKEFATNPTGGSKASSSQASCYPRSLSMLSPPRPVLPRRRTTREMLPAPNLLRPIRMK
jgi:hypothetical protein